VVSDLYAEARPMPQAGDVWRSRDPRDDGLRVDVIAVENGYVRIQRFRKTNVSLGRFHREYELVRPARGSGIL
jgi:hypothetical protein